MAEGLWDEGRRAWTRLVTWLSAPGRATAAPVASATDALADITLLRQLLTRAEAAAVKAARREGRSWSEIAAAVGMSRQSAWERWRDLDAPEPTPRPAPPASGPDLEESLEEAAGELVEELLDGPREVRVPDVVGVPWPPARQTVHAAGLVAVVVDPVDVPLAQPDDWHVVEQKPAAGALLVRGSGVSLWLARGPGPAGVREPRRLPPDSRSGRGVRDESDDTTGRIADEPVG